MKKFDIFLTIFVCLLIISIIISPSKYISASLNGISAWTFNVLPCVLPFMILTKILSSLETTEKFSKKFFAPIGKIYKTSPFAGYAFLMSIISGYPVGAKIICDLYEDKKITKTDAHKMTSFCSNSGPMYIIGTVGCLLLNDYIAGIIILISHIFSALINGLLYRKIKIKEDNSNEILHQSSSTSFGEIVYSSIQSILVVGGIICLFFIIIEWLTSLFNIFPLPLKCLFEGIIEITKASIDICRFLPKIVAIFLLSIVITFGGISTILQSIAILKKVGIKTTLFVFQKFTQAIFAGIIALILSIIIY